MQAGKKRTNTNIFISFKLMQISHSSFIKSKKQQQNFPPSLAQRPCNAKSKTSQGPFVISEKQTNKQQKQEEKRLAQLLVWAQQRGRGEQAAATSGFNSLTSC